MLLPSLHHLTACIEQVRAVVRSLYRILDRVRHSTFGKVSCITVFRGPVAKGRAKTVNHRGSVRRVARNIRITQDLGQHHVAERRILAGGKDQIALCSKRQVRDSESPRLDQSAGRGGWPLPSYGGPEPSRHGSRDRSRPTPCRALPRSAPRSTKPIQELVFQRGAMVFEALEQRSPEGYATALPDDARCVRVCRAGAQEAVRQRRLDWPRCNPVQSTISRPRRSVGERVMLFRAWSARWGTTRRQNRMLAVRRPVYRR